MLTKSIFARVADLEAAEQDAIRQAAGDEIWQTVERAARTEWLPATIQAQLETALFEVLGRARLVELMRAYSLDATEMPIFSPIARGALALFGGGPGSVLKMVPRTWGFIARDCGTMTVTAIKQHATVRYLDVPPELRTPVFQASTEGSLLGIVDFAAGKEATAVGDARDLPSGTFEVVLSWING